MKIYTINYYFILELTLFLKRRRILMKSLTLFQG